MSMHSMWSTCQRESPSNFERRSDMKGYVNALVNPKNQNEKRRGIDVITHRYSEEGKIQVSRDLQMPGEIMASLRQDNFLVHKNHPYYLADEHPICTYVGPPHHGFAFDVPRHLLGIPEMESGFPVWIEDEQKIRRVAQAFTEGMIRILG